MNEQDKRKEPKSIDELLKYLSEEKGIAIDETRHRQKLMTIGYYHGYKGYRYIRKGNSSRPIKYDNFDQLLAVYEFDARLKTIFYPYVMMIETGLKNSVLNTVVQLTNSDSFADIYEQLIHTTKYEKSDQRDGAKKELSKRLRLRNQIYHVHTKAFDSNNRIASHYLWQGRNIPIWATFELLSLGEFGQFVSCIHKEKRKDISENLGIYHAVDTSVEMPQRLIYAIKDLRNAIAHNNVIFDTGFRTGHIDKQVSEAIKIKLGVEKVDFETITDYLILIVYLLELLQTPVEDVVALIDDYVACTEKLRSSIAISIYNQIIYTNQNTKIKELRKAVLEKD